MFRSAGEWPVWRAKRCPMSLQAAFWAGLADRGFETDYWLPRAFIVGIVTGIGVLLEGRPQNEPGSGPSNEPKNAVQAQKRQIRDRFHPVASLFRQKLFLWLWVAPFCPDPAGWLVLAPLAGVTSEQSQGACMGGILALVLCGGGLAVISPWRDHLGSDLPTLWLMVTVGRLLVTPAAAVLLYFSARPPMDFFVIGIAAAFLGVLFFETPMIALDIRRQITDAEHEKPLK